MEKMEKHVYRSGKNRSFLTTRLPRNPFGFRTVFELILGTIAIAITLSGIVYLIYCINRPNAAIQETEKMAEVTTSSGVSRDDVLTCMDESMSPREDVVIQLGTCGSEPEVKYYDNISLPYELQAYTYAMCQKYDLRYEMMLALMFRESRYNVNAEHTNTNGTVDHGLCQINDTTLPFMEKNGLTDPLDPYQNIEMGCLLMHHHLQNNSWNEEYALMCYQYGAGGAFDKWEDGILTSKENQMLEQYELMILWGEDMVM